MIKTPRKTILEYELIINEKLYNTGMISEQQYNEVCKLIYEKINKEEKKLLRR